MTNVDIVQRAYDAWSRRDLEAMMAAFAPDAKFTDNSFGVTIEGRDQLRELFGTMTASTPDARMEDARYIDGGDWVTVLYTMRATDTGGMNGMPATGREFALPMCDVLHFNADGLVDEGYTFGDSLTVMTQLGLLPELAPPA